MKDRPITHAVALPRLQYGPLWRYHGSNTVRCDVGLWRYHGSNTVRCDVGFRAESKLAPTADIGRKAAVWRRYLDAAFGLMRTLPLRPICDALPPFDSYHALADIAGGSVQKTPARRATTKLQPSLTPTATTWPHVRSGTSARPLLGTLPRTRSYWRPDDQVSYQSAECGRIRNDLVARFFNRIKHCDAWPLGMTSSLRTCIRLWLQVYESTS